MSKGSRGLGFSLGVGVGGGRPPVELTSFWVLKDPRELENGELQLWLGAFQEPTRGEDSGI